MRLDSLLRLHWIANPGVTQKHRDDYASKLRRFARHIGRDPEASDLTPENISEFMQHFIVLGQSAFTANHHRTVLMLCARLAFEDGLIDKLPRVRKLKEPQRVPRGFNEHEMRRVIAQMRIAPALPLRAHPGREKGTWKPADWEILGRGIWEVGARPTSLFSVRFADVSEYLRVCGERTKTAMDHVGKISDALSQLITERKRQRNAGPNDFVLVWPCKRRHLWTALRKHILTPAGIGKETSLYGILKGATSYVAKEKGVYAAAQFRGHTDVKTTVRHYIDPRIANDDFSAIDVLPAIG